MSSRENQSTSARSKDFKKSVDSEVCRRKREELSTTIRKSAREESILKRRNINAPVAATSSGKIEIPEHYKQQFDQFEAGTLEIKLKNLENLKKSLYSNEESLVYLALIQFRKILSLDKNPPINEVVECDIAPKLIELVQCKNAQVQMEAAWALTNIASGENCCKYLVDIGLIPALIYVISDPNATHDVIEQCIWAISNIAGDHHSYRDMLLRLGVLPIIVKISESIDPSKNGLLQTCVWTISNLCRGAKPHAEFEYTSKCLPFLIKLLVESDVVEILSEICWTISYLCDGPDYKIRAVVETGIVPRLVDLLGSEESQVYTPALRAIGNILTGDAESAQRAIDADVVPILGSLIEYDHTDKPLYRKSIRKESCWALSNITAGEKHQIQKVVEDQITMLNLSKVLKYDDAEVRKEAIYAFCNATNGSRNAVSMLVNKYKAIRTIKSALISSLDLGIKRNCLEALLNIIEVGEIHATKSGVNPYIEKMVEADLECVLNDLSFGNNESIISKADKILSYLDDADEKELEDSENNEPNINFAINSSSSSSSNWDI
ncbi:putative importin subunit alpha A [Tieghemostelium lacteum]|uniref:Importin subunit alpha n=1 Tax=Tieghemostelium lacteum TaxID=361077 RepID=A0A151Z3T7_TIELA|nr:putative importin subunit alpha A [Tieghemostelium lacteum]|eukprot:KYQ88633.1 putative importin subunit alpha A [Tieghemostelium lacteum]